MKIKEGGGMENPEKEIFKVAFRKTDAFVLNFGGNDFAFKLNGDGEFYHSEVRSAWQVWQAAKAQAVPEKDAIIQKLSDQLYKQEMKTSDARVLCETACELLDDYAHQEAMVILNDLEQAMKEPAND